MQYLFLLLWTPFTFWLGHPTIACPLETSHGTFLLYSRYFLKFNSRVTSYPIPWVMYQIVNLVRPALPESSPHILFVSTMKIPKKGWRLHHFDLKQKYEGINILDWPLREEQARMRRPAIFVTKPSPLTPLLNLGTRFLVVEENCDARIIKLQ